MQPLKVCVAVAGHILLVVGQLGLPQVALVLKFQASPLIEDPDGATDGRQSRYHPVEERSIKLAGADVLLGKLGNFDDQAANLLLGLLDQVGIDRLFCAHANTSLGQARAPRIEKRRRRRIPHRYDACLVQMLFSVATFTPLVQDLENA